MNLQQLQNTFVITPRNSKQERKSPTQPKKKLQFKKSQTRKLQFQSKPSKGPLKLKQTYENDKLLNSNKLWTTDESNPERSSQDSSSFEMLPIYADNNIYTRPFNLSETTPKSRRSSLSLKKVSAKNRKKLFQFF